MSSGLPTTPSKVVQLPSTRTSSGAQKDSKNAEEAKKTHTANCFGASAAASGAAASGAAVQGGQNSSQNTQLNDPLSNEAQSYIVRKTCTDPNGKSYEQTGIRIPQSFIYERGILRFNPQSLTNAVAAFKYLAEQSMLEKK